ncbi:retrovirus-related pol polyprotein from transposon TNT 1-94 [Tanacetum coccineum]|uniref:Retrovirus-related pol polyprotein from transposon TNT 1-94 n=1 Tax=Tanacetum coccineum TaxID=301880 RepID=A0ABQ5J248_9ASTR
MEKLEDKNVSLDFTVQSLIKERDNVKLEYQKLFNSIKKTRSQTQTEMDELIAHVSEKTYAYGAIRAENQNLLFTISELKTRLANVEKGKSVNTKFDKTNGSQPLLCVTPLHKHVIQKKTDVQKSEENHVVSKPVTLQTSPAKQRGVNSNKNVIAPGMYKVVTTHESQTNEAKHDLSSTGMNAASSVRRPMNRDSHVKNSVLANSKKPAKKVAVYVRKNKQTDITSENVISNKENVIDVDVANASKAKTLLCVSCMQNVLIPCHDNCFANYKLNVHSNVRRTLSTKSRTPKSYDTTYVVHKTRFSKESTLSKSLDTTYVVSKPKIDVGSTSKANDKVSSTKKRNLRDKSLSTYMKNKIRTSRIWQKWFESKPNVVWSPVNTNPTGRLLGLIDGLPKFKYGKDHFVVFLLCERGKSKKASHPPKLVPSNHSKLELIHMDLCGPMRVASINGKKYILVIVAKVCKIHTENGTEFKNATLKAYYEKLGIMKQFSTARTPQQNGVVKRCNRTLVEAARIMFIFSRLPEFLWAEAIESMQDELNQFERLQVWELVPRPEGKNIIALKWLWKNKCDAENIVVRNKTRLAIKGYRQEEGFILKSHLLMLKKALYDLKQAPRACTPMETERLDADLQGTPTDQTTYRRMIGGLMYLTASRPDITYVTFVCARYQARPTVKHLKEVQRIFRYLRQSYNMSLWYSKDSKFELIAYSDADHAGCKDDCKSTSGGFQFLGEKLVSWSLKKQDCTTISIAEAEYVSLSACCA